MSQKNGNTIQVGIASRKISWVEGPIKVHWWFRINPQWRRKIGKIFSLEPGQSVRAFWTLFGHKHVPKAVIPILITNVDGEAKIRKI